ncbi:hypothetical protein ElyMa_002035100 [Elysia marginata]|uniref:Uncharacterized protein n=1 Tax=Elysia marginata TaxID=1093978 RepID=A0AAV4F788_9GAST|nr:hypothetical protein ElyMa_002035100 [Elysia marginata]
MNGRRGNLRNSNKIMEMGQKYSCRHPTLDSERRAGRNSDRTRAAIPKRCVVIRMTMLMGNMMLTKVMMAVVIMIMLMRNMMLTKVIIIVLIMMFYIDEYNDANDDIGDDVHVHSDHAVDDSNNDYDDNDDDDHHVVTECVKKC